VVVGAAVVVVVVGAAVVVVVVVVVVAVMRQVFGEPGSTGPQRFDGGLAPVAVTVVPSDMS